MREHGPTHQGYIAPSGTEGDLSNQMSGGLCLVAKATVALNVGDAVIINNAVADEVTKNAVTGDHFKRCGIVIGGTRTGMKAISGSDVVGVAAAAIGEQVLVCYSGVAWTVSQAAINRGDKVRPDVTTAGRVLAGLDTTDLVAGITGKVIGNALDTVAGIALPLRVLVSLS